MSVVLNENSQMLSEVIVVGYGTQKKENLTGAVSQVSSEVLKNRPVSSAISALQGTLSGVYITPSDGNPNSDMNFNVRGYTSVNGGSPLVLIDGVEGNLKLLNPSDIENVTVLKDAAASSIYGVRAAFGVVLVTTKKGDANTKTRINVNTNFSWSEPTVFYDFVDNSYDHAKFVNDALAREGINPLYPDFQMEAIKAYYNNQSQQDYIIKDKTYYYVGYIDYQDKLLRSSSPKQQYNVNISGGSGKTTFFASGGYTKQDGLLKIGNDEFSRWNSRLNVSHQATDWLKFGMQTTFNRSKFDEPYQYNSNNYFQQITFSSPLRGGTWKGDPAYPEYDNLIGFAFEDQNIDVRLEKGGRTKSRDTELTLTPTIDLSLVKNWNIHLDFTYRKFYADVEKYNKRIPGLLSNKFAVIDPNDSYEQAKKETEYFAFNAYTDYQFKLNESHNFKVLVGFNQELTKYSDLTAKRMRMISENMPSLSLGTGDQYVSSSGYEQALRGVFARINYDYKGKYLLELNGRYDGTSRFPHDDRFLFLPSVSAGWRLTEESFFKFLTPLFDNIKVRGTYGELGNQLFSVSNWSASKRIYPYVPFLSNGTTDNYLFGGSKATMINPADLTPDNLTWEKVTSINLGLDLTLLNRRLDLVFDVFNRKTKDMLISREYPEVLGANAPLINFGALTTKGWELDVNWKDKIGKDFTYNVGFNISDAQATITKWDKSKITTGNYENKKIGEIWGYVTEGIFQSTEEVSNHADQSYINKGVWTPGDIKYQDLNNDGKINVGDNTYENPGDRTVIGNTTPRYSYGIKGDLSYKGLFLNILFQGIGKRDFFPSANEYYPISTQYYNTQKWFVTDSWSEDNRNAYFAIPRARNAKNKQTQTRYLQDGSYLRLKNLTIGYSLPLNFIKTVGLSQAQIYLSGENLFTIDHIKGPLDPESAGKNGNAYYPFQRSYSFGINLTF